MEGFNGRCAALHLPNNKSFGWREHRALHHLQRTFSGQNFAVITIAIAQLAHDTSEVQLKHLSYKWHVSKQCRNNDGRTKLIGYWNSKSTQPFTSDYSQLWKISFIYVHNMSLVSLSSFHSPPKIHTCAHLLYKWGLILDFCGFTRLLLILELNVVLHIYIIYICLQNITIYFSYSNIFILQLKIKTVKTLMAKLPSNLP